MVRTIVLACIVIVVSAMRAEAQPIVGTVADSATGEPIEWAKVIITHVESKSSRGALTSEDGRFVVAGHTKGHFELRAEAAGYESATISLAECPANDEGLMVTLAKCPSEASCDAIRGLVLDGRHGKPLSWFQVVTLDSQGRPGGGKATGWMEDGRFLVTGLGPGPHFIKVMLLGYQTRTVKVDLSKNPDPVEIRLTWIRDYH
jgi:hypothetical protein